MARAGSDACLVPIDGPIRIDCPSLYRDSGYIAQLAEGHNHRSLGQRP